MCDTLCVRAGGAMWFAKNSDRHPDEPQVAEWHPRRTAGDELRTQYLSIADTDAYAFLGSRPTWLWGVEHGVNEHGLAIGNEKIWTVDRPRDHPAALIGMDLVRLGLERARTAQDALALMTELIERHGQGGSGEPHRDEPYYSSFLVADPYGGFVLETSNRTWAARPVGLGAAISNRITLTTDWTQASADVAPGTDFDTFRRAGMPTIVADSRLGATTAVVEHALATSTLDAGDLARALRGHGAGRSDAQLPGDLTATGDGFTVCMHRRESHSQTTASMITELRSGTIPRTWVALGNPCMSVYVPCFPPAIAPELSRADEWRRFARLRDRVEAAPEDFAEVRSVLHAVEGELGAGADAAWETGDPMQLADFARSAYATVDAGLRRLGV